MAKQEDLFKNVTEVSFMIFRTGSVLIVGRCDESVLLQIYEFLKIILNNEFKGICQKTKIDDIGFGYSNDYSIKPTAKLPDID